MSLHKAWVIYCDIYRPHVCGMEFVGQDVDAEYPIRDTQAEAILAGWGYFRKRGWSRSRARWVCPTHREEYRKRLDPDKFIRTITREGPWGTTPSGSVWPWLVTLSCGHEFTKLEPPAVEGKWECTACRMAWEQSGVLLLPPEIQEDFE